MSGPTKIRLLIADDHEVVRQGLASLLAGTDVEIIGEASHPSEAIEMANKSAYGNGASIFTSSGAAAREFKHRVKAGMVGINVGVPATMAMFPFTGWDDSFYGDLHIQGREAVQFYTQQKVITTRWFGGEVDDVWKK